MKKYIAFWIIFYLLFVLFAFPTSKYLNNGIPEYLNRTTHHDKFWFVLHICSGVIVYALAPIQFSTTFRSQQIYRHRMVGKLFIISSLICIISLYYNILPKGLCISCKPSQYGVTTFWLFFLIGGYIHIIQRRILCHQRFMISAFICAAYFVVVRVIDFTLMNLFKTIFDTEDKAYLFSDFAVWVLPLIIIWTYWGYKNNKQLQIKNA